MGIYFPEWLLAPRAAYIVYMWFSIYIFKDQNKWKSGRDSGTCGKSFTAWDSVDSSPAPQTGEV